MALPWALVGLAQGPYLHRWFSCYLECVSPCYLLWGLDVLPLAWFKLLEEIIFWVWESEARRVFGLWSQFLC